MNSQKTLLTTSGSQSICVWM